MALVDKSAGTNYCSINGIAISTCRLTEESLQINKTAIIYLFLVKTVNGRHVTFMSITETTVFKLYNNLLK